MKSAISLAILLSAAVAGPLFVPATPLRVGPGSGEILLADLNRDGHLDLMTKHLLSRRIAVRLGDGRGGFAEPPKVLTFEDMPGAITLSDMDGDGALDLVLASRDRDQEFVEILKGDGAGEFAPEPVPRVLISAAMKTYKPIIRATDVNEDGRPDLVTSNGRRNRIDILFGGSLPLRSLALPPGHDLYTFKVGDVNGDRHLDIVAAGGADSGGSGVVVIKHGDGKGAFADAATLTGFRAPRVVAIGDVNGDQRADIILSHGRRRDLTVLLNRDGTFVPATGSPYRIASETFGTEVLDVDGDRVNDLLVAAESSVSVFLGSTTGRLAPAPGSPFRAGPGAYNLAVGDIDEDGRPDVIASSFEGEFVTVLRHR